MQDLEHSAWAFVAAGRLDVWLFAPLAAGAERHLGQFLAHETIC